jgi:hypothetical protein
MNILLTLLLAAAQADKLPPATPLPPPGAEEAEVLATVNALHAAVSARDQAAGLAQLRPDGTATVLMEKPDGSRTVRSVKLSTYADATPGPERYEERMINPAVEIDGGMALVWGRYTFAIDGTVRHCGYQHLDLVRDDGRWKVQNITWSVRTTGCEA